MSSKIDIIDRLKGTSQSTKCAIVLLVGYLLSFAISGEAFILPIPDVLEEFYKRIAP